MTPEEAWVARREFDQLRQLVDRIDSQGSRGVAVIQYQISGIIRDYSDQRTELVALRAALEAHEQEHIRTAERAAAERRTSRRWTIGVAAGMIAPLYPLLIEVLAHLH